MKYKYNKNKDTANKLIDILCKEDFIPMSLKNHFQGLDKALTSIKTTLESGLPTFVIEKGDMGKVIKWNMYQNNLLHMH